MISVNKHLDRLTEIKRKKGFGVLLWHVHACRCYKAGAISTESNVARCLGRDIYTRQD